MKRAAVIGASKGIGRAIAEHLSGLEYEVTLAARSTDLLREVRDNIQSRGGSAQLYRMDVTSPLDRAHFTREVKKLDLLVYATGKLEDHTKPLAKKDASTIDLIYQVNLVAPTLLMKELEAADKTPENTVLIGSHAAFRYFPNQTIYSATKAGLDALAGQRNKGDGLSVQCFSITHVNTKTASETFPGIDWNQYPSPEEFVSKYMSNLLKNPREYIQEKGYSVVADTTAGDVVDREEFLKRIAN